ncbi:MAG: hypothetical protein ACRDL5_11060 [Solirubrobacteraceae bacterium]
MTERVDNVGLLVRLYASKHTHRLLPASVALGVTAALGPPARRHRNLAERRDAERFMQDLLLYTPRAGEASALARRYIREKSRIRELFWRPWLLERSRVVGTEHWEAARAGGRGCVIAFGHMGATFAMPVILGRLASDLYLVTSPHYWQPLPPGFVGLALRHLRSEYGEKPLGRGRLITSDSSPERIVALLRSGAAVAVAFDVAGSAATPFLGRSVALGGGPASLAFSTGAKVLPVVTERHGTRIDLRMIEPLDPADHPDLRSLRAAIARTFELLVLAKPEIVELPWFPSPLVTEALTSRAAPSAWESAQYAARAGDSGTEELP